MKWRYVMLLLLVLLVGCGSKEGVKEETASAEVEQVATKGEETTKAVAVEQVEGFTFTQGDTVIQVDALAEPILTALGKEMSYFEANSCAFQGKDRTYTYSGYEVQTYEMNGAEYVFSVTFLDDSVTTDEGLYLYATKEEMLGVYGEDYVEELGVYTYAKGDTRLAIMIENDQVTDITYSRKK